MLDQGWCAKLQELLIYLFSSSEFRTPKPLITADSNPNISQLSRSSHSLKRCHSLILTRNTSIDPETDASLPSSKRPKIEHSRKLRLTQSLTTMRTSPHYVAKKPASLRRAMSLRSDYDEEKNVRVTYCSYAVIHI
jgi:hypothetical protein